MQTQLAHLWKPFDLEAFFPSVSGDQYILLIKSHKFIDLDFNPQGILFGLLHSPTGIIDEETSFNTSNWNSCHDIYFSRQFSITGSTVFKDTDGWCLEDIEQYIIVEVY